MIRFIAAIDDKRGLANDLGIPWDLPSDRKYYRDHTAGHDILMGYRTYVEFTKPMSQRHNFVLTHNPDELRDGFEKISELDTFLANIKDDLWIIGGASVFAGSLDKADELYLTRVQGDFHCTKFFPEFEENFRLDTRNEKQNENGITFWYEIWRKKI